MTSSGSATTVDARDMSPLSELMTPAAFAALFWRGKYLRDASFLVHLPVLFWLVEALRPQTAVQLGLDSGTGYFALCQAVDKLNLDTRCWGSDSAPPEDDGFARRYLEITEYNAETYDRFSVVNKTQPEKAFNRFGKAGIDLLVMDSDFSDSALDLIQEKLAYRMSKHGVVLVHGVRKRFAGDRGQDFLRYLTDSYPTARFEGGDGLILALVGTEPVERLARFTGLKQGDASYAAIHSALRSAGQLHIQERKSEALEKKLSDTTKKLQGNEKQVAEIAAARDEMKARHDELLAAYQERNPKIYELQTLTFDLRAREATLLQEREALRDELLTLRQDAKSLQRDAAAREAALTSERDNAVAKAASLETSARAAMEEALAGLSAREAGYKSDIETLRQALDDARLAATKARFEADAMRGEGTAREAEFAARCETLQRAADMARQTAHEVMEAAQADLALVKTAAAAHEAELKADADTLRRTVSARDAELAERNELLRKVSDTAARVETELEAVRREGEAYAARAQAEIDDLRDSHRRAAEATAENRDLRQLVDQLQHDLQGLRRDVEAHAGGMADASANLLALETAQAELSRENEGLRERLVNSEEAVAAAEAGKVALESTRVQLTAENEALRRSITESQASVADADAGIVRLETEKAELAAECETLRQKLYENREAAETALAEAKAQFVALQAETGAREAGLLDDLRNAVAERGALDLRMAAEVAALERDIAALNDAHATALEDLGAREAMATAHRMELAAENEILRTLIAEHEVSLNEAHAMLRQREAEFANEAASLHIQIAEHAAHVEELTRVFQQRETELVGLLMATETESEGLKLSLETRFSEISEMTAHFEESRLLVEKLETSVEAAARREDDLRAVLARTETDLRDAIERNEAASLQTAGISQKLHEAGFEAEELKQSLDVRFLEIAALTQQAETSRDRIAELEAEFATASQSEMNLAAENVLLRDELELKGQALDAARADAAAGKPDTVELVSQLAFDNDMLQRSLDARFDEIATLTSLLETRQTTAADRPARPMPDGEFERLRLTVDDLQQRLKAKDEIIAELEIPTWKEGAKVTAERTLSFQLYGFCFAD